MVQQYCFTCKIEDRVYKLKLIPSGRPFPFPKRIPQIKEECGKCGRYFKFAQQEEELVERINKKLAEIAL